MKKLKWFMLFAVMFTLILPQITNAATETPLPLYFNGKKLNPEVAPRLIGQYAMVPVRIVAEEMEAEVGWSLEKWTVTITKDDKEIVLPVDKKEAFVNEAPVQLDTPAIIIDGNTLVPTRFVAEELGLIVDWNEQEFAVYIMEQSAVEPDLEPEPHPDDEGVEEQPVIPTHAITSIVDEDNRVVIRSEGELKPSLLYLKGPDRLVIDLPAASFGEDIPLSAEGLLGEMAANSSLISKIRYALFDASTATIRVVLDLNHRASYKLIESEENEIIIELKEAQFIVVLDAGHGGKDPGASSLSGYAEKDFTLPIILKLAAQLEAIPSVEVVLTRSDDTYIDLDGRVEIANNLSADLFISIHGNKFTSAVSGTETYYYTDRSLPFAQLIHSKVVEAAELPDRRVRQEGFRVIKYTKMPSILIEVGYLSSPLDEQKMYSEAFQQLVAGAIADGVKEYLHVQ